MSMTITSGNVNDHSPVMGIVKTITGKLIGDKGYYSLKNYLLICFVQKNMKNISMDITDKMMLMRRSFIETIFLSIKFIEYFDS